MVGDDDDDNDDDDGNVDDDEFQELVANFPNCSKQVEMYLYQDLESTRNSSVLPKLQLY